MRGERWGYVDTQGWKAARHQLVPGALLHRVEELQSWVAELEAWPEAPGRWMKYFEKAAGVERLLCRMENFTDYHAGFRELLCGDDTLEFISHFMGEPAVLFKEKINFKKPGGGGFIAHQDAPAFATFGHTFHITLMIAVDDSTEETGCLEFAEPVAEGTILQTALDGTIHPDCAAQMTWTPLPAKAGDIVVFDSYIPHRSACNRGQNSRRALFVTYNRRRDGDVRTQYFADKRRVFPPECEREPGVDYESKPSPYNLGNPIR